MKPRMRAHREEPREGLAGGDRLIKMERTDECLRRRRESPGRLERTRQGAKGLQRGDALIPNPKSQQLAAAAVLAGARRIAGEQVLDAPIIHTFHRSSAFLLGQTRATKLRESVRMFRVPSRLAPPKTQSLLLDDHFSPDCISFSLV